jgi:hydroxymethylglutaryl-CoA synthase
MAITMAVGIEAMACHVPRYFIDLKNLADARGVDPVKYSDGLGQRKMAIATPAEDAVYLAANAARKAIEGFGIDSQEIGMLVVGTETGVDHSKPVSVYLHQALGLRSNCTVFETKHACYGATAAVAGAVDWITSGRARGSKALIVATDVARYGVGTPGEPTQGAGAVALVVSDRPQLLSLEPNVVGEFTSNVMDFWRPLYRKEAVTDGHYSIECYLESLRGALGDAGPDLPEIDHLEACLYHVPFARMAWKAHQGHREYELGRPIEKGSAEAQAVLGSYQARTAPWLTLNRDIGNIYTGSLYLALLDLLRQGQVPVGGVVSLFSYGSGCTASIRLGRLSEGYTGHVAALDPMAELESRIELSVEEYEEVMAESEVSPGQDGKVNPGSWSLPVDRFMYLGNADHVRCYAGL